MDWLYSLFTNTESVGHIVVIYALVISIGLLLGRIKVAGILLGHIYHAAGIASEVGGFAAPGNVLTFIQDFGLILFVYCIGLQVGPGFFESFKTGGLKMNAIAVGIILLNVACCICLYFAVFYQGGPISGKNSTDLAMMVGVLCGAITNTPGLGAATEACNNIFGTSAPSIANGYACAYPLGVVGIILATIVIRYLTRTSLKDAQKEIEDEKAANPHAIPHRMTISANNPSLAGKSILQIRTFIGRDFVCSRLLHNGHVSIPNRNTTIQLGDKMYMNCALDDAEAIVAFIGPEEHIEWEEQDVKPVTKHILVTQPAVNGKTIGEMHFSSIYGCTVTRIRRGDLNLYAEQNLRLQIGDRLVNLKKRNRVALLFSHDSKHALDFMPYTDRDQYKVNMMYDALYRQNIECDILPVDKPEMQDFSQYDMLVVPSLYVATDELLRKISDFVRQGGEVVMLYKSGYTDYDNAVRPVLAPGPLAEACGFTYQEYSSINTLPLKPNSIGASDNTVNTWMEFRQPTTAQPLATVEHQFFGQWPCITENQYGKGHLIYIGTVPSTDILYRLIARAADRKGIATVERQYRFPIVLRSGTNAKGGKLHYLFNYSYEPKTVAYPYPASRSLLDSQKLAQGQNITIEPWGVVIGEEK